MGAPHGHRLHFHGHSPLHRTPAHLKVAGLVGFMLLVVATPLAWAPAFVAYAVVLAALVAVSGVPVGYLARRMVVETPVLVFAAVLPFVAAGPQVAALGLSVSEPGLVAAAGLVTKATLGVPAQLVQIMGFMVRYLDVVTDELGRMRTARESRGFTALNPRHWPVLGRSVGALFIRSFERGERVHLAMIARGYDGSARR